MRMSALICLNPAVSASGWHSGTGGGSGCRSRGFRGGSRASAEEREAVEISACGLHWEALDENIYVARALARRVGDRDGSRLYSDRC
jgi:hypothetical protein